jgi:hypothetical protein
LGIGKRCLGKNNELRLSLRKLFYLGVFRAVGDSCIKQLENYLTKLASESGVDSQAAAPAEEPAAETTAEPAAEAVDEAA